ncbi:hypothetical protein AB0D49_38025 [Streptomyces sp. NPDC048290]|uniref:hypothetical protein n=1 Tax=Streptomyces sp. NPDC048290 TaxID=3155811 RepID=UPI003446924A
MLAAFAVTLAAGLAVVFRVHGSVAALLLTVWFLVALSLAVNLHQHSRVSSHTWGQVTAWAGGTVLWIMAAFLGWLIRGRHDQPQPIAELPGDTSRRKLTRPLVMFAVIRAVVIAATVALAFGLDLSYGSWMTIAAVVAIKPSLEQATTVSVQRLAGAGEDSWSTG